MARFKRKKSEGVSVDPMELSPLLRPGYTEGASTKEALQQTHRAAPPDGVQMARTIAEARQLAGTRVPAPRAIVKDDVDSEIIASFGDGRDFRDVEITYPPDVIHAMRAGYICMECQEPQATAFPMKCSLCGFEMKERQILKLAMEFEGERHVGPEKPLREHLMELEESRLKREFDAKIGGGGSRMKGLILGRG